MIRVDIHPRFVRAAGQLGAKTVAAVQQKLALGAQHFGDPHRHGELGLRQLGRQSYEARVDRNWRIVFIQEPDRLTAYDLMNHDLVQKWLKARKGD